MTALFSTIGKGTDWYQSKCLILGNSLRQVENPFIFQHDLLLSSKPDAIWVTDAKIMLSSICVLTGFVPSRNEFRRKVQQRGLTFNGKPIEGLDVEIDTTIPLVFADVRLGKRFLELAVPMDEKQLLLRLQNLYCVRNRSKGLCTFLPTPVIIKGSQNQGGTNANTQAESVAELRSTSIRPSETGRSNG